MNQQHSVWKQYQAIFRWLPQQRSVLLMLLAVVLAVPEARAEEKADEKAEADAPGFIVAGLCVAPKRWDKEHNFRLLDRYAREAAGQGAKLVVTCEAFLDGYAHNPKSNPKLTPETYREIGETLDGPLMQRVAALAVELEIYLAVGFAERRGEKMYNSVVVFSPAGKPVLRYSKSHPKGEFYNTPGSEFPVASSDLGTLGALICYDRRFPEVPRILALKGAQILLIPAYGEDGQRNEALLRTRAWENSVWVVFVRQSQVLVVHPKGRIVARSKGREDQLVFARIVLDNDVGSGDILHRRTPGLYKELIELQKNAAE
jgi:predicted amidohydrolase